MEEPDNERTEMQQKFFDAMRKRTSEEPTPIPAESPPPEEDAGADTAGQQEDNVPKKRRILIQKDVPIPPPSLPPKRRSTWRTVADSMNAGDSVGGLSKLEADALRKAIARTGGSPVSRREADGSTRVWKK